MIINHDNYTSVLEITRKEKVKKKNMAAFAARLQQPWQEEFLRVCGSDKQSFNSEVDLNRQQLV